MKKTVEIDGVTYTVGAIDVDQAEVAFAQDKGAKVNRKLVQFSLAQGGNPISEEELGKMSYRVFKRLLPVVVEVNDLEVPKGEG